MKKTLSMVLAIAMMITMLFAVPASADEIKELHTYQIVTSEMEYFNIHSSQGAVDLNVLTNCLDGLLTNDAKGNLIPNAAKEFGSEDGGKTWKFVLNDGMKWVDYTGTTVKADVIAEDFATGLEWVLNYYKNASQANTSMPIEMIAGAKEYYEYTKGLEEAEALALGLDKFYELCQVSVNAEENSITYVCTDKLAYFPTLATYNCLYPVSAKLIEEIGVEGYQNLTFDTMWYSGAYTMTEFIHGNEKTLTANPFYWNKDVKLFDAVNIKMVDSALVAYQLFQTGELDNVTLESSTLQTIYESESNEFHDYLVEMRPTKYSYQIHFVYDKNLEDGTPDTNWNTAIANENFRLAMYYGLDLTDYLARTNAINPLSCQNYCYTANGVSTTTAGVDYTALVREKLGLEYSSETYTRVDAAKAAEYKAKAIEELTAKGVTFPVELDYYIAGGNQASKDTADVLTQIFADCLGEDFIKFTTKTYVSSLTNEVRLPQLASIYINGWGADFGDPINFLGQETYGEDNAYYSQSYSKINNATDADLIATYEEFTRLTNEAKAITDDNDARLAAFAEAEAYFVSKALCIPCSYAVNWQLTCVNDYTKAFAAYGIQAERYVNWETNDAIYTTADYEAIKTEYNAK